MIPCPKHVDMLHIPTACIHTFCVNCHLCLDGRTYIHDYIFLFDYEELEKYINMDMMK